MANKSSTLIDDLSLTARSNIGSETSGNYFSEGTSYRFLAFQSRLNVLLLRHL